MNFLRREIITQQGRDCFTGGNNRLDSIPLGDSDFIFRSADFDGSCAGLQIRARRTKEDEAANCHGNQNQDRREKASAAATRIRSSG